MARILFLEDEFLIRLTAAEVIADAGHRVTEADSVETARRILSDPQADFDLLALNVELPDGNGIDLCDELRRDGCELPTLMHSGHAHMSMVVRAMRSGGTDYLTKPYTPQELIERIDLLLDLPSVVQAIIRPHRGRGSNLPSPQSYTDPKVTSALVRLQDVRPLPGTLPVQERWEGEGERKDIRTVPLDEKEASQLQATLEEIRDLLKRRSQTQRRSTRPGLHSSAP